MSKARERRKWTEEEDSLLREAVNKGESSSTYNDSRCYFPRDQVL